MLSSKLHGALHAQPSEHSRRQVPDDTASPTWKSGCCRCRLLRMACAQCTMFLTLVPAGARAELRCESPPQHLHFTSLRPGRYITG